MRTAKTLIRLGWSESSLGAHAILLVLSWGGSFYISTTLNVLWSRPCFFRRPFQGSGWPLWFISCIATIMVFPCIAMLLFLNIVTFNSRHSISFQCYDRFPHMIRFNPYASCVPYLGPRQTVLTQISVLRRVIRVYTVCLQEFLFEIK